MLCCLHVYSVNYNLDTGNVSTFLTAYCTSILQSSAISLVGTKWDSPKYMLKICDKDLSEVTL